MTRVADRTLGFTESVIREMTRIAREVGALNLAQGFPDFPAPSLIKEAGVRAIQQDVNQYAVTWGSPNHRAALERKYARFYGMEVDGDRELTVTCGATEAMAAVMLAVVNPGDEIIVPEPFYENYGPDAVLCGASPRFLTLQAPEFRLERGPLEALITPRTRAIVVNTPNNPTGRVFDASEMQILADVAQAHDLLVVTDEIYEHIVYDGEHIALATLPGMRDRTIVVSGASKTFSVTGWRIGTIVAPADITDAIRKVHDFLTVGAPAPLQEACAVALDELGDDYYEGLVRDYRARRDTFVGPLEEAGFRFAQPEGAYYVLADFSDLSDLDDTAFSHYLARNAGVIPVPGSSFFSEPADGHHLVRWAFCKRLETLEEAGRKLLAFARAGG
jgi:aminotransferase